MANEKDTVTTKTDQQTDSQRAPLNREAMRGDDKDARDISDIRADRELDQREISGDRELSDAVRLEMLRGSGQSILPDLPEISGYHACWLSTTNTNDPIHRRMQLGYTPIRPADVPGFKFNTMKSGEFEGCICVNEMVAFKIETRLYNEYMKELHYRAPAREEEQVNSIYDQAAADAAQINDRAQTLLTDEGRVRKSLMIPEPDFV